MISRRNSTILALSIVFVSIASAVFLLSNKKEVENKDQLNNKKINVAAPTISLNEVGLESGGSKLTMDNFHRTVYRGEKKQWEISSIKGEFNPKTNKANLEKPILEYYDDDRGQITLKSKKAELTFEGDKPSKVI